MATEIYHVVYHACSNCRYSEPTRSCEWQEIGGENSFASIEDAEAYIPELAASEGVAESEYRIRQDGERYPI